MNRLRAIGCLHDVEVSVHQDVHNQSSDERVVFGEQHPSLMGYH